MIRAIRAILALEFCAALASWVVLGVEWWVTDAIAVASLVAFLRTYPDAGRCA